MKPRIDTHDHCRDGKEEYKATIKSVTKLARDNGIVAIIDKPNTVPLIISVENVIDRVEMARLEGCSKGYYLTMGLTKDVRQIKTAAEAATILPKIVELKFFAAGKGELAITEEEDQFEVYETLAKCGYKGILAVHCENPRKFRSEMFKPEKPWTWNDERPVESEVQSAISQAKLAKDANFEGYVRILHMTSPEIFDIVKINPNVYFEVTPHHLLFSTDDMRGEDGLDKKINPPIRPLEVVEGLWKRLREIARSNYPLVTIGSDHAPHTFNEKRNPPYKSGFPSLNIYSDLLDEMKNRGFSEREIDNLTYLNAKTIFPDIKE